MTAEPEKHSFAMLAEPYRRELRAHCYRMLGSIADADDATQDAMLRAFRAAETLESPNAARAWLYQIATNVCLDRLGKRAAIATEPMSPDPVPASFWETTEVGPDARISVRESVALAFMAAIQELTPLQRAVLLLRDVMGWSANEVAELIDQSVASVNSALQRARERCPTVPRRTEIDPAIADQLARYVRAWEASDASALTSLLREDAQLTMPPTPAVIGQDAIRELLTGIFAVHDAFRVIPIEVSGGPGFACYHREQGDTHFRPHLVQSVEWDETGIRVLHTYLDVRLFEPFGLPLEIA